MSSQEDNAEAQQQILPPRITEQQAATIALGEAPVKAAGRLSWYPLCGVIMRVDASRGPAKKLNGQLLYAAVDRITGEAFTTEPWPEVFAPPPAGSRQFTGAYRFSTAEAVATARRVVATALVRRVRLAARFDLRVVQVVDPLWKPNWYFVSSTRRILVDGLTGAFAVVKRE